MTDPHATPYRVTYCGAPSTLADVNGKVFGAPCSRYAGHDGPHMTFDRDGNWSSQWGLSVDDGPADQWEDWTWAQEDA